DRRRRRPHLPDAPGGQQHLDRRAAAPDGPRRDRQGGDLAAATVPSGRDRRRQRLRRPRDAGAPGPDRRLRLGGPQSRRGAGDRRRPARGGGARLLRRQAERRPERLPDRRPPAGDAGDRGDRPSRHDPGAPRRGRRAGSHAPLARGDDRPGVPGAAHPGRPHGGRRLPRSERRRHRRRRGAPEPDAGRERGAGDPDPARHPDPRRGAGLLRQRHAVRAHARGARQVPRAAGRGGLGRGAGAGDGRNHRALARYRGPDV
ncbi:MAG: hypothetical protein AVDCRST_MAG19-2235, partial [uncultured Thermomicrobiales bacterium]